MKKQLFLISRVSRSEVVASRKISFLIGKTFQHHKKLPAEEVCKKLLRLLIDFVNPAFWAFNVTELDT
ncbi:hypothetical protein, partial [Streptococcus sobrinus]|uniref:hypothetical protein n=1 Tax=Streptococcus sobrinus TaxID=1310 RepID=UPI000515DB47